jgi:hypothetical protein
MLISRPAVARPPVRGFAPCLQAARFPSKLMTDGADLLRELLRTAPICSASSFLTKAICSPT